MCDYESSVFSKLANVMLVVVGKSAVQSRIYSCTLMDLQYTSLTGYRDFIAFYKKKRPFDRYDFDAVNIIWESKSKVVRLDIKLLIGMPGSYIMMIWTALQ